jgi:hypothetical protein
MFMPEITRVQLYAYIEDALSDRETAQVEQALRDSEKLRGTLRQIIQERDRGEHSIGAIWRRQRLSCPDRNQLGSYHLQVLDPEIHDYVDFHLNVIGCPFCQANLADLRSQQQEPEPQARQRRQRIFESSHSYLHVGKDARK